MVFKKFKEMFSANDERYEALHHRHSQLKSENKAIVERYERKLDAYKKQSKEDFATHLIEIFEAFEVAKADSFKVRATDKEIQTLLMDLNKAEKVLRDYMQKFTLEEITAGERMYDPEIHEVASYQDAKGMQKGIILKTVKKGFKFQGEIIKKPKVLVTK